MNDIQRLNEHIERAYREDYFYITVELSLLERIYERLVPGYVSDRHRENKEGTEFITTREGRQEK